MAAAQHPASQQHGGSAQSQAVYPDPQLVGTEFTRQYYHVMANTPDLLHRFYTEASTFTYINQDQGGEKTGSTVQGQTAIHSKVMTLSAERGGRRADYTVQSQNSLANGVFLQVNGALKTEGKPDKRFVQSFFLATQDSGFFVLNDVFAFLPQPSPQQQQQQPQGLTSTGLTGLGGGPTENGYSGVEHGLGGFAGANGFGKAHMGSMHGAHSGPGSGLPSEHIVAAAGGAGGQGGPPAMGGMHAGGASALQQQLQDSTADFLSRQSAAPAQQPLPPPPAAKAPQQPQQAPSPNPRPGPAGSEGDAPAPQQQPAVGSGREGQQPQQTAQAPSAPQESTAEGGEALPQRPARSAQPRSPTKTQTQEEARFEPEPESEENRTQSEPAAASQQQQPSGGAQQAPSSRQQPMNWAAMARTAADKPASESGGAARKPAAKKNGSQAPGSPTKASSVTGRREEVPSEGAAGGSQDDTSAGAGTSVGQTPAAPLAPAAGTTGSGEGRPYQTSDAELERSIFVNYLPDDVQRESLYEVFKHFGPIRSVQVKRSGDHCIAYCEFEDVESAQAAIASQDTHFGGKRLLIQEKKPQTFFGTRRGAVRVGYGGRNDRGGFRGGRSGERGGFGGRGGADRAPSGGVPVEAGRGGNRAPRTSSGDRRGESGRGARGSSRAEGGRGSGVSSRPATAAAEA